MFKDKAIFLKALGEETRLKILELLAQEELCNCQLMERIGISQTMVSHHAKILKQANIIKENRNGKWIYYTLNNDFVMGNITSLCTFLNDRETRKHNPCECEELGKK